MQKVVILGGGFGGVRCALDLSRYAGDELSVTLIDRNSYHLFTPTLYEVASAAPIKEDDMFHLQLRRSISIPYSKIFAGKNVQLVQAEIASVDLVNKRVTFAGGDPVRSSLAEVRRTRAFGASETSNGIDFDYCVLALGSQSSDFGIPGVYEYAYQFKTISDGLALNKKMQELFRDIKEGRAASPISFLIIGAGFTGIELAAELASCARMLSKKLGLDKRAYSLTLFEAAPNILPMVQDKERDIIVKRLTELGVAIMSNSFIESVTSDSVKLKSGQTVKGSAVVWTAGVQPSVLLKSIHGLELTPKGKVPVRPTLAVSGLPSVYALGDVIEFIDPKTQKPVPGLAHTALAQGRVTARNIATSIKGRQLKEYVPYYDSWIAPVGAKFAVAHLGQGSTLTGFWGWLVRGLADLRYFMSILPLKQALALFRRDLMLFSKND
ncbi:MAG: hypothetical protein A2941_02715 [Candidatus Yanofskybacteria bacterium RIFCSPLOWO2_01_FULL_49_17]|uniref:FAD/NAD(P)-binding domain-containing protein n=1 Tax=Candidatus Yanofskybacteria bacterium RIFCSPLOWO2_01_FULL_49_17 TaxID=1802700 RepID=A0A1F8GR03_9BACT|nr:MAG: hypothetical protein A2941_02715 [Candidatus Yanofskybacteria bacterium RIFCSPLOWO2_01_FULL_49_17]